MPKGSFTHIILYIIFSYFSEIIFCILYLGTYALRPIAKYDFGIYRPYLVSDILRYRYMGANNLSYQLLGISEKNIYQFTMFIHDFKSMCSSVISLILQLNDFHKNDFHKKILCIDFYRLII